MESSQLTSLEKEVLRCVEQGLTNELIARHLNLSLPALEHELARIYRKFGVGSRVELLLGICSGQVSLEIASTKAA
jgi:DNA-binding CsgD family transcriptional regulator